MHMHTQTDRWTDRHTHTDTHTQRERERERETERQRERERQRYRDTGRQRQRQRQRHTHSSSTNMNPSPILPAFVKRCVPCSCTPAREDIADLGDTEVVPYNNWGHGLLMSTRLFWTVPPNIGSSVSYNDDIVAMGSGEEHTHKWTRWSLPTDIHRHQDNYDNSTMAYITEVLIDGSRHSSSSSPTITKLFKLLPPGSVKEIVGDLVKSQVLSYKPGQSDRVHLVDMLNAHDVPQGRYMEYYARLKDLFLRVETTTLFALLNKGEEEEAMQFLFGSLLHLGKSPHALPYTINCVRNSLRQVCLKIEDPFKQRQVFEHALSLTHPILLVCNDTNSWLSHIQVAEPRSRCNCAKSE